MPPILIVVTGPPLPGRWSLARGLERRCGAKRFTADAGSAPIMDVTRALAAGRCVVVDGDLPTPESRREILELQQVGGERLLVEWHCERKEAEKEVFRRYASRPAVLAQAEFARYLADRKLRRPVGPELPVQNIVRVGPESTLDEQVGRVLGVMRTQPTRPDSDETLRRVMVVEDDADERAVLADVLEELGFAVELAPDAGVAMALLDDGTKVEVLISDQRMPGMSGVELTRELNHRHPHVRTVLLTAFSNEDICRAALQAHAVTVLAKPLRVIDLERVLEEATV